MNIQLNDLLRSLANGLRIPVSIILLLMVLFTVILFGSLIMELFTERRHLKAVIPKLADQIKSSEDLENAISQSGLLKRQKRVLIELTQHKELTARMREALAERLLYEEQAHYMKITKVSDLIAKLAPMFGLLGTLIPLGPGIIALGRGDTLTLSSSLLTAFDTTIAGLISAAVSYVISVVRKYWYENYLTALETLMECVLEVERKERVDD